MAAFARVLLLLLLYFLHQLVIADARPTPLPCPGCALSKSLVIHDSDHFPGFEVESVLGYGSYGVVYKALERETGKSVAIKHMDWKERGILRQESKMNRLALPHPNIMNCSLPYIYPELKLAFLVLELCDDSLKNLIKESAAMAKYADCLFYDLMQGIHVSSI